MKAGGPGDGEARSHFVEQFGGERLLAVRVEPSDHLRPLTPEVFKRLEVIEDVRDDPCWERPDAAVAALRAALARPLRRHLPA